MNFIGVEPTGGGDGEFLLDGHRRVTRYLAQIRYFYYLIYDPLWRFMLRFGKIFNKDMMILYEEFMI